MKKLSAETWSLALCIAVFPPIWAVLAVNVMQNSSWNAEVTTFMTLFLLGGAAVHTAFYGRPYF